MALRDSFMKQMEEAPIADLMATPDAAPQDAQLEAKMNEADMAFEEVMSEANPVGDFTASAINVLIDKVNAALPLFGPEAQEVAPVEGDVQEFPTDLTKALQMMAQAAGDAGIDAAIDMNVSDDKGVKLLAGQVDSLSRNQNFKTFLKGQGDSNAALMLEVEVEPAPAAAPAAPEMGEDEMDKLFNSRMK